jgi:CBS domain containing-hemolysin-like protein
LVEKVSAFFLRWRGGAAFTGRLFGSREELRMMMQESAQALSSEERRMIERVMDLQKIAVRDSMKPLHQTVVIGSNHPVSDALRLCKEKGHTRFPVTESRDGRTTVIGMLNCDQLLYAPEVDPARPVRDFAQPALYVDEDTRLEVALRRMQRSGHLLAIVLGRDRRETGVIALRDILQVIFGEVRL